MFGSMRESSVCGFAKMQLLAKSDNEGSLKDVFSILLCVQ